jgi:hypothetical protein
MFLNNTKITISNISIEWNFLQKFPRLGLFPEPSLHTFLKYDDHNVNNLQFQL